MAVPLLAVAAKTAAKAAAQRLATRAAGAAANKLVDRGTTLVSEKINERFASQDNDYNEPTASADDADNIDSDATETLDDTEDSNADGADVEVEGSGDGVSTLTPSPRDENATINETLPSSRAGADRNNNAGNTSDASAGQSTSTPIASQGLAQNAAAITGTSAPQSNSASQTSSGASARAAAREATRTPAGNAATTSKTSSNSATSSKSKDGSSDKQSLKPKLGGLRNPSAAAKQAAERAKAKAKKRIKRALMRLTLLNPFFWAVLGGFLVLFILIGAILGFVGLFSSSSSTIEEDTSVSIPSVNIVSGNDDLCDSLTTASARSAAGCDSDGDSSSSSSSSSSSVINGWVYYNQNSPNWDTTASDWSKSCGQVAYAMILASYSGNSDLYTPDYIRFFIFQTTNQMLYQNAAVTYVNNNTDVFGLSAYYTSGGSTICWANGDITWDEIEEICDAGGCVLIYTVELSSSSLNRHWVVIQSVDGDYFTYADPSGGVQRTVLKSTIATCPANNAGCTIVFEKIS